MANQFEMMQVANECPGYQAESSAMQSNVGTHDSKSCENCKNLVAGRCVKNLYDSVASSLDQS
ncbi:hypothetical protein [Clostridium oceanicum]|uniref:DUF1540 domain-containing protein n=1 Tax=Clostridium oceanicum TaxID=1543 RepID=A0ABN1JTZ2_9CLOT